MSTSRLDAFLPAAFRGFVLALGREQRRVADRQTVHAAPSSPDALHGAFAARLRRFDAEAAQAGLDPASPSSRQTRFLMAVTADQTFRDFGGWGRRYFAAHPLAADFPPPAGVEADLGAQVEVFLAAKLPDPDLGQVLLLALAAASGTASSTDLTTALRRRLHELLPELDRDPERLFPEAYAHRAAEGKAVLLPRVRFWLGALAFGAIAYVLTSLPVWRQATELVRPAVEQLLSASG